MTCTVMEPNDLAERFLDNERHPEWQAERLGMVKKWSAAHETLWLGEYADILRDPNRTEEQREKDANAFYAEHREAMDAGVWVFGGGLAENVDPVMVAGDGTITAGTYPQTKELDGGFAVVDTPSREAALEWAAKIAAACRCAQELREFMPDPAVGN